jgi:hypothetical protein
MPIFSTTVVGNQREGRRVEWDSRDLLGEAERAVDQLSRIGLEYQQVVEAGCSVDGVNAVNAGEVRRKLELEFDRDMQPGPIPVVRALQVGGYEKSAAALHDLWQAVFWVTSLVAVSVGVDERDVLDFDVVGKRQSAIEAMSEIRSVVQLESPGVAVATDAALLVDHVARIGSEFQYLSSHADASLPIGNEEDETDEERRLRAKREFEQLDVATTVNQLRQFGMARGADSLESIVAQVQRIMDHGEVDDVTDLLDLRDRLVEELSRSVRGSQA